MLPTTEELPAPAIDERLVAPESRYEILDGVVTYVPPADPPHGERHSKISALVEAHAHGDFKVASDLLTRTSRIDDIAPDVSVFPRAPDPDTGGRQLEQLAFEVVSTQFLAHAGKKAAKLAGRGVRRIFAIDVERDRALEWSRELGRWSALDAEASIQDPALAVPLAVGALLLAADTHDAMARALVARENPIIQQVRAAEHEEGRAEGLAEGVARGRADAVLAVLAARNLTVPDRDRARILAERDPARLDRWLARAVTCTSVGELFAGSRSS